MRTKTWNRLLALVLSAVMLLGLALPAAAATAEDIQLVTADSIPDIAEKAAAEEPEIPEEEPPYAYHDVVRVSILLEEKSTIAAGYEIVGIGTNSEAMAYRDALDASLDAMTQQIEKTIGCDLDVVWKLSLAANLISANIPYGRIEQIRGIPGVAQVVIENQYAPAVVSEDLIANPNMGTSGSQTGSYTAWAAGYTGAGSRIAIIDTGLDVLHEAFAADAFAYSLTQLENTPELMETADIASVLQQLNVLDRMEVSAEELYVNGKIPFGFNYVDGDLDVSHYNNEHGSHVAGIAAANAYVKREDTFVPALSNTCVQGMAPDAQLLVMKVFGANGGAYDSDYMAAIEDAILLGADAVNLSLGSISSGISGNRVYQELLDSLSGSGVVVSVSAGNNGAWIDGKDQPYLLLEDVNFHTAGEPGTYTNVFTVASVDNDGVTDYAFMVNGQAYLYKIPAGHKAERLIKIPGEWEYVFVPPEVTSTEIEENRTQFSGRIAVCVVNKTDWERLLNLGAVGAIICNDGSSYPYVYNSMETQKPIVICKGDAGAALRECAQPVEGTPFLVGKLTALDGRSVEHFQSEYYTMSAFSSWGVPGSLELKPEITAPGGNIFSVAGYVRNRIKDHISYKSMSGTSMAAPQIAGMTALLTQYFRENSLVERTGLDARVLAQSLLMSTAVPILDSTTQYYYPVIQQGAGLTNVGEAILADSYILMHPDATASWADGKIKAELGDDPERTGVYTFTFDIHNLTDRDRTFALRGDIFTQGMDIPNGYTLKTTEMLSPDITWKLNGAPLVSSGEEWPDINGDGVANGEDGRAILEYTVGNLQLEDPALADLDGNGTVNTYDAYLFFTMYSGAEAPVAAGETAQVEVTVTLSADDREKLAQDPNGTFIQGYIFAESEGGTCHSIPMLGYYGGWEEPPMFDRGFIPTRPNVEENRVYTGERNNIRVTRAADPTVNHYLGYSGKGNAPYKPERNVISGVNGDWIYSFHFCLIRDAAEGVFFIRNAETGEYLEMESLGPVYASFTNPETNRVQHMNHTVYPYYDVMGFPEGTRLEIGVAMFTEYHVNKGYTMNDLDKLGDGAVLVTSFAVDNTPPVVENWTVSEDERSITVMVRDNSYVETVEIPGLRQGKLYGNAETAGASTSFTFEVGSDENFAGFQIRATDFAGNITTIFADAQIGEIIEEPFVTLGESSLTLTSGETRQLTVINGANNIFRDFTWTSSDSRIAAVDQTGLVTALKPGTVTIRVEANGAIVPRYDECEVLVASSDVRLDGALLDNQGVPYLFRWDLDETDTWTARKELSFAPYSATRDSRNDRLLIMDAETLKIHSVNPNDGSITKTGVNDVGIPFWDMAYSEYFSTSGSPRVHGIYGEYFLPAVDPFDIEPVAFDTGTTLVGVASLGHEEKYYQGEYRDTEHVVLLNDRGNLYHYWIFKDQNGNFSAVTGSNPTGLERYGVPLDGKNGHMFTSLVTDHNGNLYVASIRGTRTILCRLLYWDSKYHVQLLGEFGRHVWPAMLTSVTIASNVPFAAGGPEPTQQVAAGVLRLESDGAARQNLAQPQILQQAQPQQLSAYETFRMTVAAKDSEGTTVVSGNGLITVTYDPDKLELGEIKWNASYTAVNRTVPGTVTLAYVHPEGITEGVPIVELEFSNKDMANTSVKVTHKECGDKVYSYEETVKVRGPVEWVQATTSLEGNIGLNFYANLAPEVSGDPSAFVRFTYADTVVDVPLWIMTPLGVQGEQHAQDGPRRFTCPINAKNMTDVVTAQVMNAVGPVGESVSLSVATYCYYMITNSQDAELVSLMKAMLNYGAAAQILFNHNTDNLANADLSEADRQLADVDASAYAHTVTGSEEGIQVYNATLLLETETSIRIYFKLTGNKTVDQFTYTVDGVVVTPQASGSEYFLEIPDIAAQDLDAIHTVTIGGIAVTYGGLSYVNQVIKNQATVGTDLVNTAKALYAYNKLAEAYFN